MVEKQIIKKMARGNYWAHRMINFSDLIKSVPKHLRKGAKIAISDLYKEGFLNRKQGIKSEFRYSLRTDKKSEIEQILNKRIYNTQ